MKSHFSIIEWFLFTTVINLQLQISLQYQNYTTESPDLCSQVTKRKQKLSKDDRSGLIVRQSLYNYHSFDWTKNAFCRFQLKLDPHHDGGIISVIQHMRFRRNTTDDSCIDYVQFFSKDGSSSRKYCGRINAILDMDTTFLGLSNKETNLIVNNAFVDTKGEIDVHIFINKEALKLNEEMDLNIAFTAYRTCPLKWKYKDFNVKPCTALRKYCIYSGFFNDGIVNCPNPNCVDENGCLEKQPIERTANSDQIFYGALSSVFISFFIFVICILIFRAKHILCFNQDCYRSGNQTTDIQQSHERNIEMNNQDVAVSSNRNDNAAPSAPTTEEDKDLPPAYETLFPDSNEYFDRKTFTWVKLPIASNNVPNKV